MDVAKAFKPWRGEDFFDACTHTKLSTLLASI